MSPRFWLHRRRPRPEPALDLSAALVAMRRDGRSAPDLTGAILSRVAEDRPFLDQPARRAAGRLRAVAALAAVALSAAAVWTLYTVPRAFGPAAPAPLSAVVRSASDDVASTLRTMRADGVLALAPPPMPAGSSAGQPAGAANAGLAAWQASSLDSMLGRVLTIPGHNDQPMPALAPAALAEAAIPVRRMRDWAGSLLEGSVARVAGGSGGAPSSYASTGDLTDAVTSAVKGHPAPGVFVPR